MGAFTFEREKWSPQRIIFTCTAKSFSAIYYAIDSLNRQSDIKKSAQQVNYFHNSHTNSRTEENSTPLKQPYGLTRVLPITDSEG